MADPRNPPAGNGFDDFFHLLDRDNLWPSNEDDHVPEGLNVDELIGNEPAQDFDFSSASASASPEDASDPLASESTAIPQSTHSTDNPFQLATQNFERPSIEGGLPAYTFTPIFPSASSEQSLERHSTTTGLPGYTFTPNLPSVSSEQSLERPSQIATLPAYTYPPISSPASADQSTSSMHLTDPRPTNSTGVPFKRIRLIVEMPSLQVQETPAAPHTTSRSATSSNMENAIPGDMPSQHAMGTTGVVEQSQPISNREPINNPTTKRALRAPIPPTVIPAITPGKPSFFGGVELDILSELETRVRNTQANCAERITHWQGKLEEAEKAFTEHRKQLDQHNLLHPDRKNTVRNAGGILRKEILDKASPEKKLWLRGRVEHDKKLRKMVSGCKCEVEVFTNALAKMDEVLTVVELLDNVISRLVMEYGNLCAGQERTVEFSEEDNELLLDAAEEIALGFDEERDVAAALVFPINFKALSEREKWKWDHFTMYMVYTKKKEE